MGTHRLCPRFLDTTHVDTTHRLGFRGTKVLHMIRKSISNLLFLNLFSDISSSYCFFNISLLFEK